MNQKRLFALILMVFLNLPTLVFSQSESAMEILSNEIEALKDNESPYIDQMGLAQLHQFFARQRKVGPGFRVQNQIILVQERIIQKQRVQIVLKYNIDETQKLLARKVSGMDMDVASRISQLKQDVTRMPLYNTAIPFQREIIEWNTWILSEQGKFLNKK